MCAVRRWRSFLRGGSVAFYIFLYSLGFMVNTLHLMSGLSIVLYLSYMALTVWSVYLGMGTLGFICSFVFNWAIFEASKSD